MGKWFSYPRRLIIDASVPAFIAIILPVFPLIVVYILLIIIRHPIPAFDINRLSGGLIFAIFCGWMFFLAANLPRAYAYWQRFRIYDDRIERKFLLFGGCIKWSDVKYVEIKKVPKYSKLKWGSEEYITVIGKTIIYRIYDSIYSFHELKVYISHICQSQNIPMYSVDRTVETIERLRQENPHLYQEVRRRGLRSRVDHL